MTEQTTQATDQPTHAGGERPGVRLARAVRELIELLQHRGAEHAAIESGYTNAVAAADSGRASALSSAETQRDDAAAMLEREADQAVRTIEATHGQETGEEHDRHAIEHGRAESDLDSRQKEIEEAIAGARWMADAVHDAGGRQPEAELQRVRGEARAEIERLEVAEAYARKLAGPRVKVPQTMPPIKADENDDGGSETEVGTDTVTAPHADANALLAELTRLRESVEARVRRLGGITLHAFVRLGGPIFLMFVALVAGAFTPLVLEPDRSDVIIRMVGTGLGAAAAVGLLMLPVRFLALWGTRKRLAPIAAELMEARTTARAAVAAAAAEKKRVEAEISERRTEEIRAGKAKYKSRLDKIKAERADRLGTIDRTHADTIAKIDARRERKLARLREKVEARKAEIADSFETSSREAEAAANSARAEAETERDRRSAALREHWLATARRDVAEIASIDRSVKTACPDWTTCDAESWSPPAEPAEAVGLGRFTLDLAELEGGLPDDPELLEGIDPVLTPPALIDFPGGASLIIRAGGAQRDTALGTLRNAVMRLLTAIPPGKVRLTMIDPVGLGQSFASFMRLADHDERLVSDRIWTESRHIERRLADLTEHMETVIQKYLRNEFDSIEAYNRAAGEIAEPYRFLVIADLPESFSEESGRRLMSIIESGPKCGVYTLIHADPARPAPSTIDLGVIERASTVIDLQKATPVFDEPGLDRLPLDLETPPDESLAAGLLEKVGARSLEMGRVEVPFAHLTPAEHERWTADASGELRVPLGRAGATKLQQLALGRGTSQHALVAGKTGSGKSTLLHVLITNAALWFGPREVEFYLIDFKKGVEFKAYAGGRLPHARVVAVESDREFGLSVLQRLDEELKRRGDLFRELGVQSLAAAREADPGRHLPRVMLVIDEFQEFFTEDDRIAQEASLLMDRLVRQGRAFGMHVLLGSQTLSGAYTLARSTVGQMAVRVALQCSEADSYLILSEDNNAARLLSRPGEAIYNDANGMVEGNNPFQIAWLPDETRDAALAEVRGHVEETGWRPPEPQIVFEGNVPAELGSNHLLLAHAGLNGSPRPEPPRAAHAWLGEPVAIKDPTGAHFRRQSGANLLVVGQQDETARAMLGSAIAGLLTQHAARTPGGSSDARLLLIDSTPPDDPAADELRTIAETLGEAAGVTVRVAGARNAADLVAEFDDERTRREADDDESAPAWYLVINGLQRLRALRKKEDDFSFSFSGDDADDDAGGADPAKQFAGALREGPPLGMHAIVWVDTAGNLARAVDRQSMGEFEQRAVLQMSAADSANLIDTPEAGKLGMNRGLLFNEELGTREKFRPYAAPSAELIERLAAALRNADA